MKQKIMHIVPGFNIGGMEILLTNLINTLDTNQFEHMVVCLNGYSVEFCKRITGSNVSFIDMKRGVKGALWLQIEIGSLIRQKKPDIVQTYNIGTLEYQLSACFCRIKTRLHAEHGRGTFDPKGTNHKYNLLRRMMNLFVHRWIVVSRDLSEWLHTVIKVPPRKIELIYNGIDTDKFIVQNGRAPLPYEPPSLQECVVIGTVGRLDLVKDHSTLLQAFRLLLDMSGGKRPPFLVLCGEGSLLQALQKEADGLGISDHVWFSGARDDVEKILNGFDIFVLSSIAEGVSLSLLEAMSAQLPVVATMVGGNIEVVQEDCGKLVPAGRPDVMAEALLEYIDNAELRQTHGRNGRNRVLAHFSLKNMVRHYEALYTTGPR